MSTKRNKEAYKRTVEWFLTDVSYLMRLALKYGDLDTLVPDKAVHEGILIQSDPPIYARVTLELYEKEPENAAG